MRPCSHGGGAFTLRRFRRPRSQAEATHRGGDRIQHDTFGDGAHSERASEVHVLWIRNHLDGGRFTTDRVDSPHTQRPAVCRYTVYHALYTHQVAIYLYTYTPLVAVVQGRVAAVMNSVCEEPHHGHYQKVHRAEIHNQEETPGLWEG